MKHEDFECDTCGKKREMGPQVLGWVDMAEVVMADNPEQRRWQFCSSTCIALFAATFKPVTTLEEALNLMEKSPDTKGSVAVPKIGQYL